MLYKRFTCYISECHNKKELFLEHSVLAIIYIICIRNLQTLETFLSLKFSNIHIYSVYTNVSTVIKCDFFFFMSKVSAVRFLTVVLELVPELIL